MRSLPGSSRPDALAADRRRWGAALGVAAALASTRCDGQDGPTGPHATLLAEVRVQDFCSDAAVVEIVLRATPHSCADAPCDTADGDPPIDGDRYSCPATDLTVTLGVAVETSGIYGVAAVPRLTTGHWDEPACYTHGGNADVVVDADALRARAAIALDAAPRPCPG